MREDEKRGAFKKHLRVKEAMRKEGKKGDINKRRQKLEGKLKSTGQESAEMSEMKVEVMGGYQGRERGVRKKEE